MNLTIIAVNTKYGRVSCRLKEILKAKKIGIYRLSRDSNIKYEILKKYYNNEMQRYDSDILAKICFCLNCEVSSLLKYEK